MPTRRAAIYCRISKDREGLSLGVTRQRAECESLAKQKRWKVVDVFTDNDVSAYSGKVRPEYQRLLRAIEAGSIDVVVAWHPDRLHRSPAELEDFIALIERMSTKVETVQAGQWDLGTPAGRLTARQIGSVARYESEHRSERVRLKLAQNARSGIPHGRRAFGWDRSRVAGTIVETINDQEAALIRLGTDSIINGDSLAGVTRAFADSGVLPPKGGTWHKQSVRAILLRPRNAGRRQHHGRIVGDGAWEPIVTGAEFDQLVAVLRDPARRTSSGSRAKYLLSSIARCGVCEAPMSSMMNRTVPSYRCAARSCVSRSRQALDEYVEETLLIYLERIGVGDLLSVGRASDIERIQQEASGLRARLDLAADEYADGKIDARQLARITGKLRPQIEAAEQRAAAELADSPVAALLAGGDVRAAWASSDMSIARKRTIIGSLFDISVHPTKPGIRRFDPSRVSIKSRSGDRLNA